MKMPTVSTILKEASEIKSRKDRLNFLKSHHPNTLMKTLLKYVYDPNIKFALPEGKPPYKPCDNFDIENVLYTEQRRLYLFLEGGNPNLSPLRREILFVQLLESIEPAEAELLLAVKDKKLPYKGITEKLVREAFPSLLP
jgi:hypothetical protein